MLELVRDFLDPAEMYKALRGIGIDFFCGVPDSLLKGIETSKIPGRKQILDSNHSAFFSAALGLRNLDFTFHFCFQTFADTSLTTRQSSNTSSRRTKAQPSHLRLDITSLLANTPWFTYRWAQFMDGSTYGIGCKRGVSLQKFNLGLIVCCGFDKEQAEIT